MGNAREFKFGDRNLKIFLDGEADESVFREVFLDRDYMCLDDQIREASTIVDIGGHLGFFAMYAGILNPSARIFVYEPDERNFGILKRHLKENRIDNVMAKNVAVVGSGADNAKMRDFYLNEDSHNHSLLDLEGRVKVVKVPVKSFSSVIGEGKDLVKMDCEGGEFEIFEGIDKGVLDRVGGFYVEYHEYESGMKVDSIVNVLREGGFKIRKTPSRYDKRMGFVLGLR